MDGRQTYYSSSEDAAGRKIPGQGLAWLLDRSIPLPGGFRIGLDGILGLIPGVGDAIGGGLSSWIFYLAWKQGVPRSVLLRMGVNIAIDSLLGAIPLLGDLFDFFWKSNSRNLALLERYRHAPRDTSRRSMFANTVFFVGLLVIVFAVIWACIALAALLWQALFQSPPAAA